MRVDSRTIFKLVTPWNLAYRSRKSPTIGARTIDLLLVAVGYRTDLSALGFKTARQCRAMIMRASATFEKSLLVVRTSASQLVHATGLFADNGSVRTSAAHIDYFC